MYDVQLKYFNIKHDFLNTFNRRVGENIFQFFRNSMRIAHNKK